MSQAPLGERFFKGISATGFAAGFRALSTVIGFAILVRLVSAETMAAYGLAWAASALGYTMSQAGAAQGLVDIARVRRGHRGAAFTMTIVIALLIAVGIAMISGLVASSYDVPRLDEAFLYAAAFIPLMSLGSVDIAILQRRLNFVELARIQSLAVAGAALTSVIIALFGYELLGLFALQGTVGLYVFIISRLRGALPVFHAFTSAEARTIWKPGRHLALGGLTGVISQQLPLFLIGKLVSAEALGFFVLCLRIVQLLGSQFGIIINSVLLPTLSRMQSDMERIGPAFLHSNRLTLLGLFAPLAIFITFPNLILSMVAGDGWLGSPLVLVYLALMQAFYSYGQGVFSTFRAINRPSAAWRWNLFIMALAVFTIWLVKQYGADLVYFARAMAFSALSTFIAVAWLGSHIGFTLIKYFKSILPPTLSWVVASAAGILTDNSLSNIGFSSTFSNSVSVLVLVTAYAGLVFILMPEIRTLAMKLLRSLKMRYRA